MHDLGLNLGAVFVHHLHQRPMGVDRIVGAQMQATGSLGVMIVNSGGAQRDQPDPALGAGGEVVAGALATGSPSGVPYIVSMGDMTTRLRTVMAPIRPGASRCGKRSLRTTRLERVGLPVGVGVADDAANVAALQHVLCSRR